MPFRDITGHRRLVDLLVRSIGRGTLPPSLIFAGPAGAGPSATALALAQFLNCNSTIAGGEAPVAGASGSGPRPQASAPPDACGVCASCTRIARFVHPDVLVVEPGDNGTIRIDQVREIVDRAAFRPFEGRRRVVIVNEADTLVVPAQNALLKTLEEPPSLSIFILLTSRPDMLLATVRSRCIRLTFADDAAVPVDVEAREVAERVLVQAAPAAQDGRRLDGAKALLVNTGGGGAGDREQLATHLRAMGSLLRDIALLATQADARALANADVRPSLDRLVPAYRGERGVRAFAAVDTALAALDRNAGVKIVADWLVLQL